MHSHQSLPLPWGTRTFIMGIINVTPDSFSGDGILQHEDAIQAAVVQAELFTCDKGPISSISAVRAPVRGQHLSMPSRNKRVSSRSSGQSGRPFPLPACRVDTYRADTAREALAAGADWINDVWGFHADPELPTVAAEGQVPVILMHNRLKPGSAELEDRLGGRYVGVEYDDLIEDIRRELLESVALAHQAGIPDENIILDPGIGFGKTVPQNLELLDRLDEIKALGYPLLVGPSRKSFIGYTLDLPPEERIEGTAAAVALSIDRGADIVRVHDVGVMARVVKMADAIVRSRRTL
jgi:dihydropteroate synthase